MKNFKKLVALGLAVTMMFGSTVAVFASETTTDVSSDVKTGSEKEITGAGSEAFVDKNVMKVTLPTTLTNLFNYKVDPQGLVSATGSYDGTEVTGTATGVVFKNAAAEAGGKATISSESDPVKITNKSSIPVEIGITTTLTAAASGLALTTLANSADFTTDDNNDKALYLGLKSTNDKEMALNTASGTASNILLSGASQYEAKYDTDTNAYAWAEKDGAKFDDFTFSLTGAINTTLANDTWATYDSDGKMTAVKNPPTVSVKFTLTGVRNALDLGAGWTGNSLYVYKTNGSKMDGDPETAVVNGKAIASGKVKTLTEGEYKDYLAIILAEDLATAFGYTGYASMTDEEKAAVDTAIKGFVKSVKITDDSKTFYGEL